MDAQLRFSARTRRGRIECWSTLNTKFDVQVSRQPPKENFEKFIILEINIHNGRCARRGGGRAVQCHSHLTRCVRAAITAELGRCRGRIGRVRVHGQASVVRRWRRRVGRNQALFHPLLLLHSPILKPNLKCTHKGDSKQMSRLSWKPTRTVWTA